MEKLGMSSDSKDEEANIKVLDYFLLLNPYSCKAFNSFTEEHVVLQWEFWLSMVLRIQSYFFNDERTVSSMETQVSKSSSVAESSTA